jgi:hypothetical protein
MSPGAVEGGDLHSPLCRSCSRRRSERREIITEIYETELKYGRDLRIILDEFYSPIQVAGLLTKDSLEGIFLNVSQLIEINIQLTLLLKAALDEAAVAGQDEDLGSVNVGRIFLEIGEKMMSVFESYCTRQVRTTCGVLSPNGSFEFLKGGSIQAWRLLFSAYIFLS